MLTSVQGWETRYAGSWINDVKEGQGTMSYSDGSKYEGQWKNDLPHGKGVLSKANGDSYTGYFKQGKVSIMSGINSTF